MPSLGEEHDPKSTADRAIDLAHMPCSLDSTSVQSPSPSGSGMIEPIMRLPLLRVRCRRFYVKSFGKVRKIGKALDSGGCHIGRHGQVYFAPFEIPRTTALSRRREMACDPPPCGCQSAENTRRF